MASRTAAAQQVKEKSLRFQADLTPKEAAILEALKEQIEVRSNADLLSNVLSLLAWLVRERQEGRIIVSFAEDRPVRELASPILDRVAPEYKLPKVEMSWTRDELNSFAALASKQAADPTPALVRALARK
jgi:hypothetical protein